MTPRWRLTLTTILILLAIAACSSPATPPGIEDLSQPAGGNQSSQSSGAQSPPGAGPEYSPEDISNWSKTGEAAIWPDYIPEDIPQLEGKIRKTMEAETRIRIFYESVSSDAYEQWLKLLEQKGFSLDYVVYVEEGFPDNSEERIKKGDFDAIDITKDKYHLNITFGSNAPVLDIDISGFEFPGYSNTAPTPSGPVWPEEYALDIPQPERCPLIAVDLIPPHDYRILCQPADDKVADDYKQALTAAGYHPNTILPASDGSLDGSIYAWGNREISMDQPAAAMLIITIADTTAKKTMWPAALEGVLPAPEGCPLKNVLPSGNNQYLISCDAASEQVITAYIDRLISDGFTETSRMETQSGEPVWVKLEKADLLIDLMISHYDSAWGLNVGVKTK